MATYGWKYGTTMGNVLDPFDQLTFDAERATGVTSIPHPFWVYNRPVDLDGLREFNHHLRQGLLSRRIEPSPLPFGRHRWISADGPPEIEIVATPRPRAELDAWLEEQAARPIDAVHGPGWHLATLPFTDGGAAVSLTASHCLADGIGLLEAMADAADGRDARSSWPAESRRRWRRLREDARQTVRDMPDFGRGAAAAIRLARRVRRESAVTTQANRPLRLPAVAEECLTPPTATAFIDATAWQDRAAALGGTSNTLLAGLSTRLGQRIGRVTADGSVLMKMPVNERVAGDTRANAVSNITVPIDPAPAATDLRGIRAAIKQALVRHGESRDDERAVLSLVPLLGLLPKRFARVVDNTVVVSNLGEVNPRVTSPDGTRADIWASRLSYRGVTEALMDSLGGVLYVLSGTALGRVFVSVSGYQPGYANSNEALRQDLLAVLADFDLAGTFIGAPPVTSQ